MIKELKEQLSISPQTIQKIAEDFQEEMARGLVGKSSSLKMLPSYLNNPSGQEQGTFLALDFGGTNLRVLLVDLLGQGRFRLRDQLAFPLKDQERGYDYTSDKASAQELFDFIAVNIAEFIDLQKTYYLGHTFSFPFRLEGKNRGILINWTKEIKTKGVEGQEVTALLTQSLTRQGLNNVLPKAILNDTVGTQLTAAYQDPHCRIGSIIGTGHNSCYLEKDIIINMESGNFNLVPQNKYDKLLDADSEQPGSQLLEKLVSGKYIGEIVRLIVLDLQESGLFSSVNKELLARKDGFSGAEMSLVLQGGIPKWQIDQQDLQVLREICSLVMQRSAALAAASYLGVFSHLGLQKTSRQTIAIDGSLFEKMPGYAQALQGFLDRAVGGKGSEIILRLTKDGSGIGAAIAAAVN